MLDANSIRDRLDEVFARLASRGIRPEEEFGRLIALNARRRELIQVVEGHKREQNAASEEMLVNFFSQGLGRVNRVAEALQYGIVGINTGLISTEVAPFGGVKESGIGREGSSYGIDEWLELKYWAIGGLAGP